MSKIMKIICWLKYYLDKFVTDDKIVEIDRISRYSKVLNVRTIQV